MRLQEIRYLDCALAMVYGDIVFESDSREVVHGFQISVACLILSTRDYVINKKKISCYICLLLTKLIGYSDLEL